MQTGPARDRDYIWRQWAGAVYAPERLHRRPGPGPRPWAWALYAPERPPAPRSISDFRAGVVGSPDGPTSAPGTTPRLAQGSGLRIPPTSPCDERRMR